jgi:hypothetical protein
MTVRLNVLFNGSPDDDVQTLHEVVGRDYSKVAFSRFGKWRLASKNASIWSLDLDVLPIERPKMIFMLETLTSRRDDVLTASRELTAANNIMIHLWDVNELSVAQRITMKENCVDICDRVFVVNSTDDIDSETQSIIDIATQTGKRVAYLNY